jgi:dihydropteroate synthase
MGILNITPDSFYDGGKYKSDSDFLTQVETMLADGATFIDIGAYSSRPGADHISEKEELDRLLPVLNAICTKFDDVLISVDTFRSNVAKHAINHGAAIINDISAGKADENMLKTIKAFQVPYIMMHMRGTPQNMSSKTKYENILVDVVKELSEQVHYAKKIGINDLIVDPGIGFAKNTNQNFTILKHLDYFNIFELPILLGVSRKSMIYKTLDSTADKALNGTSALNSIGLTKGAAILRVHDVKEAVECIQLFESLESNSLE